LVLPSHPVNKLAAHNLAVENEVKKVPTATEKFRRSAAA
jgi:hypothetical protein